MIPSADTDSKPAVLFCPSYIYRYDDKQWKDKKPYPPLGTLIAAAYIRNQGYPVRFFDTHMANQPSEIINFLDSDDIHYVVIYDDGFNYLTKMCLSTMRQVAFDMMAWSKKKNACVIVCNSDATDHYALYLQQGADFVVLGEGELGLLELLNSLSTHNTLIPDVSGIAYIQNDKIIKNTPRPILQDLDSLPDAAWDLIDLDAYKKIWTSAHGYFSLNMATTRGCPFKCNWCAKPIYGNRYHSRSANRVAQEMKFLKEKLEADHIWMADDIFGLNKKWMAEFNNAMAAENILVPYKIQSRADLLVQENYVDQLKNTGCTEVWIGAESGSQKILDAMDKGISLDQIKRATLLLQSKSIRVGYFLQFGYLNENLDDIKSTVSMLLRNMPDDIGVSVSYPLPGTSFYDKVKSQLGTKQNWKDSDDLAMMYQAPFSPAFYKRLHRLVHKLFRLKQGWLNFLCLLNGKKKLNWSVLRSVVSIIYYLPATAADKLKLKRLISTS